MTGKEKGMATLDDLREALEGVDTDKLATLIKSIEHQSSNTNERKPYKKDDNHGKVKTYTTVIKKSTCLFCDTSITHKYNLSKGEKLYCVDESGQSHSVTSTGKVGVINLATVTSKCQYCEEVINNWSKDELLVRIKMIRKAMTFKEVAAYHNFCVEEPYEDKQTVLNI